MRIGLGFLSSRRILPAVILATACSIPLAAMARPYIYSAQWDNGNIDVLDARTFKLRDRYNAGETASWATLNRSRTRLYALNDAADKLVIFDTRDGSMVREVPIAGRPINVYVPDDDSRVYVGFWSGAGALVDAIAVVDTLGGSVVQVINGRADVIAVSPDGASLFVGDGGMTQMIRAYDTATFLVRATGSINQTFPKGMRVSPDGSLLYLGGSSFNDTLTAYHTDTMQPAFVVATPDIYNQNIAFSFDGRYVYSVGGNGGMAVVDSTTAQLWDVVGTCAAPDGISLSPDSRLVYVMCTFSHTIDVFDAYTHAPLGSLSSYFTPNSSVDFIGTPPGEILVSNSLGDSISQIVPQSNTVADFGVVGAGQTDLVISRDRRWLYVGLASSNSVAVISLAFSPPPPTTFIALDSAPDRLAVSPDGTRLYASHGGASKVSVIDLGSRTVIGTIDFEAGSAPLALAVSKDNRKLYVGLSAWVYLDVLDTSTFIRSGRLVVEQASAIALDDDGAFGYAVGYNNHLYKIDTSTDTVVADWPDSLGVHAGPPGPLSLSPDGARAYVGLADNPDTTAGEAGVSVIDTATGSILNVVPLWATPGDIATGIEGRYVYVSLPTLNSVAVVDSAQNRVLTWISGFNGPGAIADQVEAPANFLFRDGFD